MNRDTLIILGHGINSKDGHGSIDKLEQPLKDLGYDVDHLDYGRIGVVMAAISNRFIATKLAKKIALATDIYNRVVYVGHSLRIYKVLDSLNCSVKLSPRFKICRVVVI